MVIKDYEYEEDVKINPDDLDGEWIKQPALYVYWATKYAEALAAKSKIELKRKILKANLYKQIKAKAEEAKIKITDSGTEAELRSNPEYEKVSLELINAEETVNKLDAIKWGFEHKKKALENLSKDAQTGFNMSDSVDQAARNKVQESLEQDKVMREKLNKRKG